MFNLNDTILLHGQPFVHEGVQYPGNYLQHASEEEKAALGVIDHVEPTPHDHRFYWDHDTPKDLDDTTDTNGIVTLGLKTVWKQAQEDEAVERLAASDWRVLKSIEDPNYTVEPEWVNHRAAIRAAASARQAEIDNCADVDALAELLTAPTFIQQTDENGDPVLDEFGNPLFIANPSSATPWPEFSSGEQVTNPYDDFVIDVTIADSTQIFADGAPATADPNGVQPGWLYENAGNGDKINWYLFYQDPQDINATTYSLGDITSLYLKLSNLHAEGTRLPHISIYTLPLGDGQDAETWYRSRVTYDLNNPAAELFAGSDPFITYLRGVPQLNQGLLSEEMELNQTYSNGPQAPDERLLMIAVSSDSAANAGDYYFALDEFCIITSDNRRTLVNTLAQAANQDDTFDQTSDPNYDQLS